MKMVGFDRRIRLEWLDEVAFYYHKTRDAKACAEYMYDYLAQEVPGHRTRRNLMTIMKKLWTEVPNGQEIIRDQALELLTDSNGRNNRLAVHWALALSAYPFFRDVVSIIGNMFSDKDELTIGQLERRVVEVWGERPTVKYATGKLFGSLTQWGVLEKPKAGRFVVCDKKDVNKEIQQLLIKCLLRGAREKEVRLYDLLSSPALFPYRIDVRKDELAQSFELTRQGLNTDIIALGK